MKKIKIAIPQNPYDVYVGQNIFNELFSIIDKLKLQKNIVLVIDKNLYKIREHDISRLIKSYKSKMNLVIVSATEKQKSFVTLQKILFQFIENKYGRDSLIIALGGGIVGDITGFASAVYSRGIQYVQVPTTLLAAVDSSVGGKTGINFGQTKNIIGAFNQPKFVLIDPNLLSTLPKTEMISGLGEVIKYAYLTNNKFYEYVSSNIDKIIDKENKVLQKVIEESVRFKGDVVIRDEKESGVRKILNLGHTFAHALEVEQNHKIKHGHAVIVGIMCALYLSLKLKLINEKKFENLSSLIHQVKHLIKISNVDYKRCIDIMKRDKKNRDGKIKFVLIKDIGKIVIDVEVKENQLLYALTKGTSIFK